MATPTLEPAASVNQPFNPNHIRLRPGPFAVAMESNARYLLQLDVLRLMHGFYVAAGLEPKGEPYGGWEQETIAGHSLGHYLSACAWQLAGTGDPRFSDRLDLLLREIRLCQDARSDGYVGGVPDGDRVYQEIRRGEIRSKGFDLNGIWVPWYNLHKLFAGLLDAYEYCDREDALPIASKLGHWAADVTANLTADLWQQMLNCEHGGMNEVLARLYRFTGDESHLVLARKFHHKVVLDALERNEDCLPGLHGNTQIPKVLGAAELYRVTNEDRFRKIADNFFWQVLNGHTYAIGGNTSGEYFGPTGQLAQRLTMSTAETCKTYNMVRLAHALAAWDPSSAIDDYVERALWNHILPSQDPETGMYCYFVSLHPGHFKTFSTPFDSFWCCVGTGMENHARYGESIFRLSGDALRIAQYIPCEANWQERGIRLVIDTNYPKEKAVRISLSMEHPTSARIELRCPAWAEGGVKATCGEKTWTGNPGGYLSIERIWKDGDVIEMEIPMGLRWIPTPDSAQRAALAYGPVVLVGDLGSEGMEEPAPFNKNQGAFFGTPVPTVPVLVTNGRPIEEWLKPEGDLVFRTKGVGRPHDVVLKPFYEIGRGRYTVYWSVFDEVTWTSREAQYREEEERQKLLQSASVDVVQFGEMQPEREHNVEGEKTYPEAHAGQKMRVAWMGGWFECRLKTMAHEAMDLVVSYWGADGRNREFDIYVDGEAIAYETFSVENHNTFFDRTYPIPKDLSTGKTEVVVRFRARDAKIVGPICSCRTVRRP